MRGLVEREGNRPDSARDEKGRKRREQRRKEVKNGRDLRQRETRH
jgi:hypothetical protein